MKASRVFVLTIFTLLLSAARAEGCTCGYESPADAFNSATAVFVGRVVSAKPESPKYAEEGQTAVALVEESFKGARVGSEIVFIQPGDTCTPTFSTGARLLFYANYVEKTKTWTVYGCTRSTNPEGAADDLLYLRALPLSAERNRVSGVLRHYEDGPDKSFTLIEYLAGVKVRIKGKDKTYEATTNADGVYELYDLPPGKYTVEPELPFGLKVRFPMQFGPGVYAPDGGDAAVTVELTEKTCAGADFIVNSDNSIGGRVLGPGGAPMPNVCVELFTAAKAESDPYGRIYDCTDAEGRYKLEEIPPGKYFLVANAGNRMSGSNPFPSVYYPGTFEKEKASVVSVGRGDSREGFDVAVPSLLPTVTASGVLLYSDGHPAADVSVTFQADSADGRYARSVQSHTDDAGRFTLTLLKGVPGKLSGNFYVYEGAFEKLCPAVKKLIEQAANNGRGVMLDTPAVAVRADADASDVRLVFPVPFCPPKKKDDDKQ